MHRSWQPLRERLAEAFEAGRREREQAGAVIRAVERDDPWLARGEQRSAESDLHCVLAGDTEFRRPGKATTQRARHLGVGKIAERMRDRRRRDRVHDARVAVSE